MLLMPRSPCFLAGAGTAGSGDVFPQRLVDRWACNRIMHDPTGASLREVRRVRLTLLSRTAGVAYRLDVIQSRHPEIRGTESPLVALFTADVLAIRQRHDARGRVVLRVQRVPLVAQLEWMKRAVHGAVVALVL